MPSDLIRNTRKKLQDSFTILVSHPVVLRRKSQRLLASINQIQIQDSFRSNEESATLPPTKPAALC
jgi:hypothetical protein